MATYDALQKKLDGREVVILDGAVGTQLQRMGVPMSGTAWAATALQTHPYTVRLMHEQYIKAGVDIITVNTYSAARHNLVPVGLGDVVRELNIRAVALAQEARDRCAKDRPVYIAGSVSNYGLLTGSERSTTGYHHFLDRVPWTEEGSRANLREQAEILAEAGVDFILAEPTGGSTHRRWVIEACVATGMPVWMGFKCHQTEAGGAPKVGYQSDEPFAEKFRELSSLGGKVVTMFHSPIAATNAALPIIKGAWKGPIAVYPEAERHDYVAVHRDPNETTTIGPDEFVKQAKQWVAQGVQIVGGCCGIELEYIRPLREALPRHVPA